MSDFPDRLQNYAVCRDFFVLFLIFHKKQQFLTVSFLYNIGKNYHYNKETKL